MLLAGSVFPAASAETYENARFGYSISVPDGFGPPREAENGDGVTVRSPKGHAELLVYGYYLTDGTFQDEVATGIEEDRSGGWNLSLRQTGARAATWSGTKGGRILYVRAIPLCEGAVGTFRLEYDQSAKAAFGPVVGALAKSFRAMPCT